MNPTRASGALISPTDYRDEYLKQAMAAALAGVILPPSVPKTYLGGTLDQDKVPACVGHGITKLIKRYWFRRTGRWVNLSPRFLDILSSWPGASLDAGRDPRVVLKIATNTGISTTDHLPNDTKGLSIAEYRDPASISSMAMDEAGNWKIPGFFLVPNDKIREAIYLYGAVSTTYLVGKEMWTPSWADKDIDPMRPPAVVLSGHQMDPNGYEANGLINVENQWGETWANGGANRYSPDAWNPYTFNTWAIADIPQDVAAFLKTLPSPSSFFYNFQTDLHQGDYNEQVKWAQVALMIDGYLAPVTPDELGYFGPKTAAAVARFQAANKISPVPGSIGPLTRTALNKKHAV